jgi:hypothetical protein
MIEKLKKIKEIINSEGTILSLYENDEKSLYLCSRLEDNIGYVYFPVNELNLKKYLKGKIILNEVYNLSDDFIVKFKSKGRVKSYFKEDLSDKLVLGGDLYINLPNDMK